MAKSLSKNIRLGMAIFILFTLTGCSFLGLKIGTDDKIPPTIMRSNIGGVFKSIDKGESFKHKVKISDKKSIDKINVLSLQFDPQDSLTLYLLSKNEGLWVSYNGAESWEQLLNDQLEYLILDSRNRGVIYVSKDISLLKSKDGGSSWETIFIDISDNKISTIAIDPTNSDRILVGSLNGYIFESNDQGKSWRLLAKLKIDALKNITINPKNSQITYAATALNGVYKTTDGGHEWEPLAYLENYPESEILGQFKLNPRQPSHLYVANKYGILKSEDGGLGWQALTLLTPKRKTKILTIGFNPFNEKELYYATKDSFFYSFDDGANWSLSTLPTTRYPIEILVDDFDPNIIYVGVTSY